MRLRKSRRFPEKCTGDSEHVFHVENNTRPQKLRRRRPRHISIKSSLCVTNHANHVITSLTAFGFFETANSKLTSALRKPSSRIRNQIFLCESDTRLQRRFLREQTIAGHMLPVNGRRCSIIFSSEYFVADEQLSHPPTEMGTDWQYLC